jgi:hypothetical protein
MGTAEVNALVEVRRNSAKLSMRWPVDEETTRRLKGMIAERKPLPWWRRLLRRLTFRSG